MDTQWIKPAIGGLAVGVFGTAIVGFTSLGWVGPSTAEEMAAARAETEVVAALTPLCVANAKLATPEQIAKIKEASYYRRGDAVESAGWVAKSSTEYLDEVAEECAEKVVAGLEGAAG